MENRSKKTIAILAISLLILLASCAKSGSSGGKKACDGNVCHGAIVVNTKR